MIASSSPNLYHGEAPKKLLASDNIMEQPNFPIIDFGSIVLNFDQVAKELFAVSTKWGFFILTGHGIEGIDRMFQLVKSRNGSCDFE